MTAFDLKKVRGLKALLQDVVINGAKSIEAVHKATAARPFNALEMIPTLVEPAQVVRAVHDAIVTTGYAATRAVTEAVGAGIDLALDAVESAQESATSTDNESERQLHPAQRQGQREAVLLGDDVGHME